MPSPVGNTRILKNKKDLRFVLCQARQSTVLFFRARVLDAIRKIHLLVLTGLTINQADRPRTVTPLRLLGKHEKKFKTSNLVNDMCVTRFNVNENPRLREFGLCVHKSCPSYFCTGYHCIISFNV